MAVVFSTDACPTGASGKDLRGQTNLVTYKVGWVVEVFSRLATRRPTRAHVEGRGFKRSSVQGICRNADPKAHETRKNLYQRGLKALHVFAQAWAWGCKHQFS